MKFVEVEGLIINLDEILYVEPCALGGLYFKNKSSIIISQQQYDVLKEHLLLPRAEMSGVIG